MKDIENKPGLLITAPLALTQTSKTLLQSSEQQPKEKPNRTNTTTNIYAGVLKHTLWKYSSILLSIYEEP